MDRVEEVVREAERAWDKVFGDDEHSYREAERVVNLLKSCEDVLSDDRASNLLLMYLYRLCVLASRLGLWEDAVKWGEEYFETLTAALGARGLSEEEIEEVVRSNPLSWQVWFTLASAYCMNEKCKAAVQTLCKALGKEGKIVAPASIVDELGGPQVVALFITFCQVLRLVAAAMEAKLVPLEAGKKLVLDISSYRLTDESASMLKGILSGVTASSSAEKVIDAYLKAGASKETCEIDVSAAQRLLSGLPQCPRCA